MENQNNEEQITVSFVCLFLNHYLKSIQSRDPCNIKFWHVPTKNCTSGGNHRMVSEKSELTIINGPHILHDDFGLKYISFFLQVSNKQ
jgi:hypothetical protein